MLIYLVAGARPNFMKIAPLYHALAAESFPFGASGADGANGVRSSATTRSGYMAPASALPGLRVPCRKL